MGRWLQNRSFVKKMRQYQKTITTGDDSVQRFHIHSDNTVGSSRRKVKRAMQSMLFVSFA